MKVEKKFNELLNDLIIYTGDKSEVAELLGVEESKIDEYLQMEQEPIEGLRQDIKETIESVQSARAKESSSEKQELSGVTEPGGILDRNIIFFNGREVEYQVSQFSDQIEDDKTYNVELKIIEGGEAGTYSFPIQGEYLKNISDWESLAYAQYRNIIGAWGTSEVTIDITGIG